MLKVLRKKGVMKKILWVVAVIIIISFGILGSANYLDTSSNTPRFAGKIFGQRISFDQFAESYRQTHILTVLKYGKAYSKVRSLLNLEQETWDRLILLNEAQKRNIRVSDKEVIQSIEQFPAFQRDGRFDALLYDDIVRSHPINSTPRDFEEAIRSMLIMQQLYTQETSSEALADEEVREAYQIMNEKVQVSYALISTQDFEKQISLDIQSPEIAEFYNTNPQLFTEPPSINVEYLSFDFPAEPKTDEEQKLKADQTVLAEQVYADLTKTPDLKGIADKYQLTLKESGFFSVENPRLDLGWSFDNLQQIFQLSDNKISAPLETNSGLNILRIKERKEKSIPPFETEKLKARRVLIVEKAKAIAKEKASELAQSLKQELTSNPKQDFAILARFKGLTVEQTPLFLRGQYLPALGIAKEFEDASFSLNESNKMSDVVQTPKGFCIIHLDSRTTIDEKLFEKEKEKLAEKLLLERKDEKFKESLVHLRLKAELEDNVSKLQSR